MRQVGVIILCAGMLCLATGCMTSRITTTDRTAVEQALLSQAAEASVAELELPAMPGKTYHIDDSQFDAIDGPYIMAQLNRKLLAMGMKQADAESAELIVYPQVANAGIDDHSSNFGMPELPVGIPGLGALTLPQISLFGYDKQMARNRMTVYAKNSADGSLAFASNTPSTQRYYTRWSVLFLISFRLTDLTEPF